MTLTQTITLELPDGSTTSVTIRFNATYEHNPKDLEPERLTPADSGWVIEDLELDE